MNLSKKVRLHFALIRIFDLNNTFLDLVTDKVILDINMTAFGKDFTRSVSCPRNCTRVILIHDCRTLWNSNSCSRFLNQTVVVVASERATYSASVEL
eukprot:IDg22062t1